MLLLLHSKGHFKNYCEQTYFNSNKQRFFKDHKLSYLQIEKKKDFIRNVEVRDFLIVPHREIGMVCYYTFYLFIFKVVILLIINDLHTAYTYLQQFKIDNQEHFCLVNVLRVTPIFRVMIRYFRTQQVMIVKANITVTLINDRTLNYTNVDYFNDAFSIICRLKFYL